MRNMMPWKYLALVLCAAMLLAACGQKGDLYLPQGQAQTVQIG